MRGSGEGRYGKKTMASQGHVFYCGVLGELLGARVPWKICPLRAHLCCAVLAVSSGGLGRSGGSRTPWKICSLRANLSGDCWLCDRGAREARGGPGPPGRFARGEQIFRGVPWVCRRGGSGSSGGSPPSPVAGGPRRATGLNLGWFPGVLRREPPGQFARSEQIFRGVPGGILAPIAPILM